MNGFHILAAAAILTALNAAKPVHIDDPAYLRYAAEFAAHPGDPYGFQQGSPVLAPANQLLVPPVLPYWLGLGITLFGDDPTRLKLWQFPFALLLSWSLAFLAARFAPSLAVPLIWLGVLSPTLLPGFNLMLEVPVLALGLASVAAAICSVEKNSIRAAALSGILGGLAVQTKYTGAVSCAAAVAWFVMNGRFGRAVLAAGVAAAIAAGWEWLLVSIQGESHFLVNLRQRQASPIVRAFNLVLPLISQMAGLAPAIALLGCAALGRSRRALRAATIIVLAAVAALACGDSQAALLTAESGKPLLTPSNLVSGVLAFLVWPVLFGVGLRLAKPTDGRRLNWFLLVWLVLELGGYFALSPFPASRRLTGTLLVVTLAVGRAAHLQGVNARTAARFAAAGVSYSLLFFAADWWDADAARTAARRAADSGHAPAAGGAFRHLSWWGVAYYSDRAGLQPLEMNREPPRPGDLLAVHDVPELRAFAALPLPFGLELTDTIAVGSGFPLRLVPGYYDGRTPLEGRRPGRCRIFIYRVVPRP
jgi:hypothetical protein